MAAKQKTFPVVGIRVPAPDKRTFDKRSHTICIRLEPMLHLALSEMAEAAYMKVSTFAMRILWAYVADQRLFGNQGLRRKREMA